MRGRLSHAAHLSAAKASTRAGGMTHAPFRPRDTITGADPQQTIQGDKAMPMLRKGQIAGLTKGDVLAQHQVINQLLGLAASRALTLSLLSLQSVLAIRPCRGR
jgi:hypothetical protein